MEEAQKYIGDPYVWGGASPETSFDCSGFVSWVYTESGVYNTGRLGATGLYGICKKITPEQAQPGDLVFFEGTMGDAADGITHVGIYVGGNHMLHCGSPIGYADLRQYRTNELVRRRMNFSSDAMADFEGLLEVNRKICKQQMAEKASPTLPTNCAVLP